MNHKAPRQDHWTTSLDAVEALRTRVAELDGPPEDAESQRLMASVLHAKSASFISLLDSKGFVLDVNPASAGWVWMPTATLVKGMRTFDTIENRGYILVETP